jgi:membrane associated rhomboid family serine protease
MLEQVANSLGALVNDFTLHLPFLLTWIGSIWVIYFFNLLFFKGHLNTFGIYPRHWLGLRGVFFAPFLHGSFSHLLINSVMLLILAYFVLVLNVPQFYCTSLIIMVFGGVATWLVGRPYLHIGASGLLMGYWSYIMVHAYEQPSLFAVVVVVVCLYYFGSMLLNLFPEDHRVSWESHLFGLVGGIIAVYLSPVVMGWL